jgi:hypothetical protein
MTGKSLVVRELQDERLTPPAAPAPSGQLVGIEKPEPVAATTELLSN